MVLPVALRRNTLAPLAALALACGVAPAQGALGPGGDEIVDEALRARYGFAGFEIYAFEDGVSGLVGGDVDGDGVLDLALSNPARSRVEVLVRLPEEAADEPDAEAVDDEPNPIVYDGRYRRVRVPLERALLAHAFGDLDGDGLDELVCAVDGGRLRVVSGLAREGGPATAVHELALLREGCDLLRCLDLDGDGRDDLLAATDEALLWWRSGDDGPEGAARVLDHDPDGIADAALADLDGDGRADLVSVHLGRDNPFRYRPGRAQGGFGPRIELDGAPIRSGAVRDLDGDGRAELLAVARLSGRLVRWAVEAPDDAPPAVHRYTLRPQRDARIARTFGVGDLDGNGASDVVFASPELAEVSLFLGGPDGALRRVDSPGMVDSADPRVGDLDGDGAAELVTISKSERMIGVARPDAEGRLPFPTTTPLDGEPEAMDLADVDGDGFDDVVLVASKGEGRARTHELQVWSGSATGLGEAPARRQEIEDLRKVPSALLARDVSRDGRADVVLFLPGSTDVPRIFVQRDDGFASDGRGEEIPGLGVLAGAGPARVSGAGDELLVAARHFVRALHFRVDDAGRLEPVVGAQTNAPSSRAQAVACAALDADGDGTREVALLDAATNEVLVLGHDGGPVAARDRIPVRGLGERGLVAADVDGDGREELLLFAADGFGVLGFTHGGLVLREVASHEPERVGLRLAALATGDLDHDGTPDVAVAETTRHALVLLRPEASGFERALGFRVFEERTFGSSADAGEPRELLAGRLSADDKDDLAVLVHDKLILYLQE